MSQEDVEFIPRRIARWINSPEAIVRCTNISVQKCVGKVLDALEIIRLLDFFDVLRYTETIKEERMYGENEKRWYNFLRELEEKYPIKVFIETENP